jgi:spermidine/putrescine transport system permease protein
VTALIPGQTVRRGVKAVTLVGYTLLLAPIATVVVLSFFAPETATAPLAPTLVWYRRLFADASLGEALRQSLVVAAAASAVATVIGTMGAIAIERGRFPGRALLEALTLLPLALPELVLGIASLIWFATLRLTLGTQSIVLAHATFAVSYVVVTVRASLRNFDPALIDAACDLGCTPAQAYRKVVLPLILPGIVGGGLMAFTLSFDDFLISFFTAGVGADTLPMRLYSMIRFGLNEEMYALSALLIMATAAAVGVHRRLMRRPPPPAVVWD